MPLEPPTFVAFHGEHLVASGPLRDIAIALATQSDHIRGAALIFDAATSEPADIDFDGSFTDIVERTTQREAAHAADAERRGRGRPRLGVVAREVTLLPRHWEWLAEQPGGASVALRRLVEEARRASSDRDAVRRSQEATYRFMAATLGNAPGFEDAIRALFQGNAGAFHARLEAWPRDLRDHARRLAARSFERATVPSEARTLPDATGA